MPKRITVLLDDEVYAELLTRGGGKHKISHALNQVLREALGQVPRPAVTERIDSLQQELDRLRAEVQQQRE